MSENVVVAMRFELARFAIKLLGLTLTTKGFLKVLLANLRFLRK